jgi:hypothetical protein
MEAIVSYEISAEIQRTTRRYIPEDSTLQYIDAVSHIRNTRDILRECRWTADVRASKIYRRIKNILVLRTALSFNYSTLPSGLLKWREPIHLSVFPIPAFPKPKSKWIAYSARLKRNMEQTELSKSKGMGGGGIIRLKRGKQKHLRSNLLFSVITKKIAFACLAWIFSLYPRTSNKKPLKNT